MQFDLFSEQQDSSPVELGHAKIYYKEVGTLLNKTSGFMEEYDLYLPPNNWTDF